MKRFVGIPVFLVVLVLLALSCQTTAFAAPLKGSITGHQMSTMIPNCPSLLKNTRSVTPQCVPPAPCLKTACYGIDPYASGCATAATYNKITYVSTAFGASFNGQPRQTYGYITNYYSSWCVANWALVSLTTTGYNASVITSLWIRTTDTKGHAEEMCYPNNCNAAYYGPTYPTWTNMIDGTNKTFAYVDANIAAGASLDPFPAEADQ